MVAVGACLWLFYWRRNPPRYEVPAAHRPTDRRLFWIAAVGAGSANLLNNLPSYVAGESVVPVANHDQLIGLLIGTNVGPLVVPWASLATMIWAERCRAGGLKVDWKRHMAASAVAALVALVAAVGALLLTRSH